MINKFRYSVYFAIFLVLFSVISIQAGTVHDVVKSYPRPGYIPSADDVSIRSLNFRPRNKEDDQDTFEAIKSFHATRLEWVYLNFHPKEKKLIDKVKRMGLVFGASGEPANGVDVELAAGRDYVAFSIKDLNGEPIFMEHSRHWVKPIYPGCVNNPVYRKRHLEYYIKNVKWGAETLQRDSSGCIYHFASVGRGCYCEYCLEGFREYLKENFDPSELENKFDIEDIDTFNYKEWLFNKGLTAKHVHGLIRADHINNPLFKPFLDFQANANAQFFKELRTALNIHAMKFVPFSHNNTSHQIWGRPHDDIFDFAISEIVLKSSNPAHIYGAASTAREWGQVQVFGTPKSVGKGYTQTELNPIKRQVIATSYASGGLCRVPWDMFEDTKDGAGRYFGKPEHFADLYGFVRAIPEYLESYEDAGAIGPDIEEKRYGEKPVTINSDKENIYAFIRAIPKDKDVPIVIHLVDWNKQKEDFEVILNNDSFFPGKEIKVSMLTPVKYNKRLHDQAWDKAQQMLKYGEKLSSKQSSAYSELVEKSKLKTNSDNGKTKVKVKAVKPWAVLVIEKI